MAHFFDVDKATQNTRIVKHSDLLKAVHVSMLEKMKHEETQEVAFTILNFFGYNDEIIDNTLEKAERDLFYMLEENGLLRTDSEEISLYDGREWRTHYWLYNKERIFALADGILKTTDIIKTRNGSDEINELEKICERIQSGINTKDMLCFYSDVVKDNSELKRRIELLKEFKVIKEDGTYKMSLTQEYFYFFDCNVQDFIKSENLSVLHRYLTQNNFEITEEELKLLITNRILPMHESDKFDLRKLSFSKPRTLKKNSPKEEDKIMAKNVKKNVKKGETAITYPDLAAYIAAEKLDITEKDTKEILVDAYMAAGVAEDKARNRMNVALHYIKQDPNGYAKRGDADKVRLLLGKGVLSEALLRKTAESQLEKTVNSAFNTFGIEGITLTKDMLASNKDLQNAYDEVMTAKEDYHQAVSKLAGLYPLATTA